MRVSPDSRVISVCLPSAEGLVDATLAEYLISTLSFLSSLVAAGAVMSPERILAGSLERRMIFLVLPYS